MKEMSILELDVIDTFLLFGEVSDSITVKLT